MKTDTICVRLSSAMLAALTRQAKGGKISHVARVFLSEALASRGEGEIDPSVSPVGWPKGKKRDGRRGKNVLA